MKEAKEKEVLSYSVDKDELDNLLKEELQAYIKPVQASVVRILQAILKPVFEE